MNGKLIFMVEDEKKVLEFNGFLLEQQGFRVETAMTLADAWTFLGNQTPDAIILDRGMPDGDGVSFLQKLRQTSKIPVLLLTGYGEGTDIMFGYDSGCDDYVTKPYDFGVLLAKLKRLLQNAERIPDMITRGLLQLDVVSMQAFLNSKDLLLTQKEFSLLLIFVQNEDEIVSMDYLYEKVWKAPMTGDKNTVQVTVSKLRKKLESTGYDITTLRRQGYVFEKN